MRAHYLLIALIMFVVAPARTNAQQRSRIAAQVRASIVGWNADLALPHPIAQRGGAPPNDECSGALVHALVPGDNVVVNGDNTGATDTEDFGNPNVWEAFELDTCATVVVSYCGTSPVFPVVYSIITTEGCPPQASVQHTSMDTCADGNWTITYTDLPPGIYYVPVLMVPGVCEGPYTITFSADWCSTPPPNDRCADAITVPLQTCGQGAGIPGNNSAAVLTFAPPSCGPTNATYHDVWYSFNSGSNTELVLSVTPGTIGQVGVEVVDACGGVPVYCAFDATEEYVQVDPNTTYKVRVFTDLDLGSAGSFLFCVGPVDCTPGVAVNMDGDSTQVICAGSNVIIDMAPSSGSPLHRFVVTTSADTVIEWFEGEVFQTTGYAPGEYHIWSVGYTQWPVSVGSALFGVGVQPTCFGISERPLTLVVDICQGLRVEGSGTVGWPTAEGFWLSANGDELQWVEVFDESGRRLWRKDVQRNGSLIPAAEVRASGVLAVVAHGRKGPVLLRWMVP